ncbi:MAG: rhodanese-like domain-containing protein [Gammaproteobacteria bacterium]|nr:rhodanese-like domain-containing protein [Gammaproteobacteria bacterium]
MSGSSTNNAVLLIILCVSCLWGIDVQGDGAPPGADSDYPVKLTKSLPYLDLTNIQPGRIVRLQRVQDTENMVDFEYALTSRPCPPYCIQPIKLSDGIETVGELEVIDYIRRINAGDDSVLIIDSRTENWLSRGMIPGAISIPWKELHYKYVDQETLLDILIFQLGVIREENFLNFENAKTLVLYCNGNWCGQSVTSIRSLQMLGYPSYKLKWYRAGMQAWRQLGLTMVTPVSQDKNKHAPGTDQDQPVTESKEAQQ